MEWLWCEAGTVFDSLAADRVAAVVAERPEAALALPTGRTPAGLYAELARRVAAGRLSLSRTRLFNLDEYVGLAAADPASFAFYLRHHLVKPAGIPGERVRLLRGDAADLGAECRDFDAAIAAAGGLDLAILGLGANGHIAFNEPGSAWQHATHVAKLTPETRHAGGTTVGRALPELGLTLGIATLRAARAVLLLIAGRSKRAALAALEAGIATRDWPVTCLLDHPRVTVLCSVGGKLGE
jgi:glucosamine-6-phosphate deaminase